MSYTHTHICITKLKTNLYLGVVIVFGYSRQEWKIPSRSMNPIDYSVSDMQANTNVHKSKSFFSKMFSGELSCSLVAHVTDVHCQVWWPKFKPSTHMVEGQAISGSLSSDLHIHTVACGFPNTYTINQYGNCLNTILFVILVCRMWKQKAIWMFKVILV